MKYRHRFTVMTAVCLLPVWSLSSCSRSDETDQPPQAVIVHPAEGDHLAAAPDSVLVVATDDQGIVRVEISIDDQLLSTVRRAPYKTRLPVGIYADGLPHVLRARAFDTRGQTGDAPPVTVTIDPSLQTVPQIVSLTPAPEDPRHLRMAWLSWPESGASFTWEAAGDDGFFEIAHGGGLADTTVQIPDAAASVVYARVRATVGQQTSAWSRVVRHSGLPTWRTSFPMAGAQLGAAVRVLDDDGRLLVLSYGTAGSPVSSAPVKVLQIGSGGVLSSIHDILPADYKPTDFLLTAEGRLILAGWRLTGASFLAASDLAADPWTVEPAVMHATAFVQSGPAGRMDPGDVLAAGADRRPDREPGACLFAAVSGQGVITPQSSFRLLPEYEIRRVWATSDGGFVLAGQVLDDAAGSPGGVWVCGLSAPDDQDAHEVLWTVRLGTAHRWLLCGAGTDGHGIFVIAGAGRPSETSFRYGFLFGIDQRGHVRWQITDRNWQQFSGVAADVGGRWVAAGARRRDPGDQRYEYETAIRGLSPFGATLWESVHRAGRDAQAWALAAHPGGGWYVAGARLVGDSGHDVDLLRVDDRGELR